MKTWKVLILLIVVTVFSACNDNNEVSNLTVDEYVEMLKAGQYDSISLPAFTYSDIPALLKYRNEKQVISNYPINPISSFYKLDCKLGIYVLWTIESIRASSIGSKYAIMGFPSLNPILVLRDSAELKLAMDETAHETVAKAYFDWWENNKQKNFDQFKDIDPLSKTEYKWH